MNFTQRLSRYLVGIFIGVLMAFFLFGQRNCTGWMPENRVKVLILENPLFENERVQCLMECNSISSKMLRDIMREAEVDFAASSPRESPKKYTLVETAIDPLKVYVEMADSSSTIVNRLFATRRLNA